MSRLFFLLLLSAFFAIGLGIGFLVYNGQSVEDQALVRDLLENQEQSASLTKQCEDDFARVKIAMSESQEELIILRGQFDTHKNDKAAMVERITQLEAQLVDQPMMNKQACEDQWADERTAIRGDLNAVLGELEMAKNKISDLNVELAKTQQELEALRNAPPIKLLISR